VADACLQHSRPPQDGPLGLPIEHVPGHIQRLEQVRDLLTRAGQSGAESAALLCFSGAGFSPALTQAAHDRADVHLVGLSDLYGKTD
jgi:hypothetical protein